MEPSAVVVRVTSGRVLALSLRTIFAPEMGFSSAAFLTVNLSRPKTSAQAGFAANNVSAATNAAATMWGSGIGLNRSLMIHILPFRNCGLRNAEVDWPGVKPQSEI